MAELVYILCAIASTGCAFLLFSGYRRSKMNLLLWSAACFAMLALGNIILVIDLIILPDLNFHGSFWRNLCSAVAGTLLLSGLIWELA